MIALEQAPALASSLGPAAAKTDDRPGPGPTPLPTRSAADWIGFVGFLFFGGWVLAGPRSLGIFLVVPVLYEVGTATTFLLRGRAQRSTTSVLARLAAYGATFLIPVFVRWALRWHPSFVATTPAIPLRMIGASLWLFGLVLGFWPLWYLRTSFSVEPAARTLVTSGPYRIVRHPIYTSYVLSFSGLLLLHLTVPMALVAASWFTITRLRIRCEEQVLEAAFPEYEMYRRQVGALSPRWWSRWGKGIGVTASLG